MGSHVLNVQTGCDKFREITGSFHVGMIEVIALRNALGTPQRPQSNPMWIRHKPEGVGR
jgi:hypothetical protein